MSRPTDEAQAAWADARVASVRARGVRGVGVMVMSIDGRAAVDGKSEGLGTDRDFELFRAWRRAADLVLVGPGTLEAERYKGGGVPRFVTISRSLSIDLDKALEQNPSLPLTVYTTAEGDLGGRVDVVRLEDVGPAAVVADARERYGLDGLLVCEGGPVLLAAALEAGVCEELSLTIGPRLLGQGTPLVPVPVDVRATVVDCEVHEDAVFIQFALSRD